jgi:hypothetical protein
MVCINMSKEVGVLFHSDLQFVFCLPCIISSGSLMKWTNCLNSAEAMRIRLEKKYLFDKNEIGAILSLHVGSRFMHIIILKGMYWCQRIVISNDGMRNESNFCPLYNSVLRI